LHQQINPLGNQTLLSLSPSRLSIIAPPVYAAQAILGIHQHIIATQEVHPYPRNTLFSHIVTMRASTILGSLLYAATAFAQAVPEGIAPDESSPDGCEQTVEGNFTIGIAISVGVHKRESASEVSALNSPHRDIHKTEQHG
jgi:hypothetical protein